MDPRKRYLRQLKIISENSMFDAETSTNLNEDEKPLSADVVEPSSSTLQFVKKEPEPIEDHPKEDASLTQDEVELYATTGQSDHEQQCTTVASNESLTCNLCSYKTFQSDDLEQHMTNHVIKKLYICHLCDYKSLKNAELLSHMKTHAPKTYSCRFCDYQAFTGSHLKLHIWGHKGETPFPCHLCEFQAFNKSHLKLHLTTHAAEKPFVCYVCKFRASNKTGLNLHIRIHAKTGYALSVAYPCKVRHHIRKSINNNNIFACNYCDYITPYQGMLNRHTRQNHQIITCSVCKYRTTKKFFLKLHMKLHMKFHAAKKALAKRNRKNSGKARKYK